MRVLARFNCVSFPIHFQKSGRRVTAHAIALVRLKATTYGVESQSPNSEQTLLLRRLRLTLLRFRFRLALVPTGNAIRSLAAEYLPRRYLVALVTPDRRLNCGLREVMRTHRATFSPLRLTSQQSRNNSSARCGEIAPLSTIFSTSSQLKT